MNVQNFPEEKPTIIIAKIEMCWFMAINGKQTVEFDSKTNLINGSHNEVKQSIAKAIDVMLCSDYEESRASLSCRHESKHPLNKRQSYVKMHLIGTSEFALNAVESTQFHITRYFNKNDVDFVFTSVHENVLQIKQSIQMFHRDLSNVEMLRSLDPFIAVDCMPNGSDINQLIVKMLGLKECATEAKSIQNSYLVDSMHAAELLDLTKIFTEQFAGLKDSMIKIRTLKCALIKQQMDEIKENHPDVNVLGKERRLLANDIKQKKLNKKLNALQFVLDHRCKMFNANVLAERKAVENFVKLGDQQRFACLDESLKDFCTALSTMVDQMKGRRTYELGVYENQRAGIEWHKVNDMTDPAQIADEMKKIDAQIKKMAAIQKICNGGKTDEHLEERTAVVLQALSDHIDSIKKINDDLIEPAKKVFLFNRQKFIYYQQSMNHECEMAIARAKMEEFYASDNWLHESQIEAMQKGHELLSVYSNEFHERFLGHIGQFIDVNTDFNILRVVLPILSKNFLSAFIFSRKDVAEKFVKSFLAANPDKRISAFGKDEWADNLEGDAPPGVSMADKILTAETLRRYPFIGNFFRTFRIIAENRDRQYCRELAANGIYKIFNRNYYYDKSSVTCVEGANNIDYLQDIVMKWANMGKNLRSQLDLGYKKCVAINKMDDSEQQMIQFESELNKLRLKIRVHKEQIVAILRTHKEVVFSNDKSLKFRGECRIKDKVFHMKREWLKDRRTLQTYKPIVLDSAPEINLSDRAELAFLCAIERFTRFYANGFPQMVYQSEEFTKLTEWISNCENIESSNLQIEPQPNDVSDDNIEQRLKRISDTEAAYEKLFRLCNEQRLLREHIDFCMLDTVEELAQNDRENILRQLDEAQQNIPPNVILPGSDINKIVDNLVLFDDDANQNVRNVSAVTMHYCPEARWLLKRGIKTYFKILLKILRLLNEFYDWNDQIFVFRLNAAHGTKTEYIDHENQAEMPRWIRNFTVQELCADDTRLNFYLKFRQTGEYAINDDLDIKRHALVTLLHTALSRSMNPSLFVLNNTIVGRSANEVADIIEKYRPNEDDEAVAQLILFARSDVDYRVVFDHPYKSIECRAENNNRWNIIQTNQ